MFKPVTNDSDNAVMHQQMISQGPLQGPVITMLTSSSYWVPPLLETSSFISVLHHTATYSHDHDHSLP